MTVTFMTFSFTVATVVVCNSKAGSKRRDFGGDYRPRFGRALRAPSSELKFRAIEQVGGDFTKFPPAGNFSSSVAIFKMAPPTVRVWTTEAESKLADFLRGKASQMTRGILAESGAPGDTGCCPVHVRRGTCPGRRVGGGADIIKIFAAKKSRKVKI